MRPEIPPRSSDPNAVIAELEKLLIGVVGEKISVKTNLDPQLGRVTTDPTTIRWVLANLAVHALKAMLARNVVITTSNLELDPAVASGMKVSPGSYVRIELSVTGTGVDAQPAIWNLVQNAHGAVTVRDTGAEGITMTVLLPSLQLAEFPDREPSWRRRLAREFHRTIGKVMPIMHVSDEDLELYFLGRLPSDQVSAVESHLTECSSCTNRLSNVTGVFLKLLKLKNRHPGNYEGI